MAEEAAKPSCKWCGSENVLALVMKNTAKVRVCSDCGKVTIIWLTADQKAPGLGPWAWSPLELLADALSKGKKE